MMTIHTFQEKKLKGQKISMVTCYDTTFAKIVNQSKIDCVLVGDSAAMVMHGHTTTVQATVAMMVSHIQAVVRGAPQKFIVGDMPFLENRKSLTANMNAIQKIMQAGCHAIKLEGADGNLKLIEHVVQSGVPVMGHLGLTPQSIHQLGGFKVQGREKKAAEKLLQQALALQEAGCFAIALECVPSSLAKKITEALEIPTIGIGAGPDTSGQVLVLQDLLGMDSEFKPKFLKQYLNGFELIQSALNQYHQEVTELKFPTEKESYQS